MGKRNKPVKEFYTISTFKCGFDSAILKNEIHFENKQDAINRMNELFKKCYPHDFNCNHPDVIEACIQSPKYNDHDCYLQRFYTTVAYCYELSINEFEQV